MSEEQRRAGLLLRIAARFVDIIIIAAVIELIPRAGYFAGLAYLLLGDGLFDGRSIGKKLIRLQVISTANNSPCTYRDSILRNTPLAAGYLLWWIPWVGWFFLIAVFTLEFILILGSSENKRLGDEIAGTVVIEG